MNSKIAYTVPEALAAIGLGRTNFYSLVSAGKIKVCRVGGRTLVPAASLQRLIDEAPPHDPSSTAQGKRARQILAARRGK